MAQAEETVAAEPRSYSRVVAVLLFLFLLLSDLVVLHGRLLVVRHLLVAGLALAAAPFVFRHLRSVVRAVLTRPLMFFVAFLVVGFALSPTALAPANAAIYALAYGGLVLFAVAVVGTIPLATTFAQLRVALGIKLVASLILGLTGGRIASFLIPDLTSAGLQARHLFGGLFGNPNPLCTAAALYLLLATCHLVEQRRQWPRGRRTRLQMAWYGCTIPLSAYLMWQSLSRSAWVVLAIACVLLIVLGWWRSDPRTSSWRRRALVVTAVVLAFVIAIPAVLVSINSIRGLAKPDVSLAEHLRHPISSGAVLDAAARWSFWRFALTRIRERPWTGYGMCLTPMVFAPLVGSLGGLQREHAHNLELEATLYAGVPAGILIALFSVASVAAAARALLDRRPLALSVAATMFFLFLMAQVDPVIFGSPYPSLLVVLILAAYLAQSPKPETTQR